MSSPVRHALTNVFLVKLLEDFIRRGQEVFDDLAAKSPEKYLALVAKATTTPKDDRGIGTMESAWKLAQDLLRERHMQDLRRAAEAAKAQPAPNRPPVWQDADGKPIVRPSSKRHH